ncbi:phage/plasmid primase, P4 family [Roseomonas sp. BN140053]|uniref:phage/plasmid primase, P4 family n=1 Tax=Roseomonas sp. BN140053 TaxID=3391898 RepID=UPI0039ED3190
MNAWSEMTPEAASDATCTPALERPVAITVFSSYAANSKREGRLSLEELAEQVRSVSAARKDQLPWLKLARFGDTRTERGSLRHDANLLAISGIEADYDGEQVPFDSAAETLAKAGVLAMVYTSPSHREDAPRWRVLCPFSAELPPGERDHLLGRLNGLFGGVFSAESWTLSQAYYYGRVGTNPDHRVELLDGTAIDLLDELDEAWIGKPNTAPQATTPGAPPRSGPVDEAALLAEIISGKSYHEATVRLLGRWARDGVALMNARQRLQDAMDAVPEAERDARWQARRADIDRCLEDIYVKEARARDEGRRPASGARGGRSRPPPAASAAASSEEPGLVTEDSVATAFVQQHGAELRYCHDAGKWYRWTGAVWQRENTRLAFTWARLAARELALATDEAKVAVAAGKASFASGVERFALADPAVAVTSAVWDADPWLLGTPGGTVDLRTGELRPARPADHISRSAAITPADTASCPAWLAFLDQATGGDQELIAFLQRWLGYCLTGITSEHALLFVYGPGGNGKGVLLNTVAGILGSYSTTAAIDTFTAAQGDRHPTDLAMLHGARMVMATETEEGRAWAEARIKVMTGGDPISARFMRQDFFTFTPAFKLTISGNHKPALRNVDDAARRRFNVVPFLHKPAKPDPNLPETLRAEWPGILRWMIEGCLAWQRDGLARPRAVLDATTEYFAEQDVLAQWVEECCEQDRVYGETSAALFASWRAFATSRAEEPRNAKWFATMLERQGFQRVKDCDQFRGRGFRGLRIIPEASTEHWGNRD